MIPLKLHNINLSCDSKNHFCYNDKLPLIKTKVIKTKVNNMSSPSEPKECFDTTSSMVITNVNENDALLTFSVRLAQTIPLKSCYANRSGVTSYPLVISLCISKMAY